MRNRHREGRKQHVNLLPLLIDSMKTPMCDRIAPGDVIAVVGKLFTWREPRRLSYDFVTFDHQLTSISMRHDPFAP